VQTGYALSAANALLQVVEVALPKQKKAQAVSEFKHSVIAYKRRARVQENSGLPHIPQDVLVHIFTFLDMRSLVAAGLVCWSWNSAANDNNLWKINYSLFFGLCHLSCNSIPVSGLQKSCELVQSSIDSSQLIQILGGKSPSTVHMQNVHHGSSHQIEHYVGIADQLFG